MDFSKLQMDDRKIWKGNNVFKRKIRLFSKNSNESNIKEVLNTIEKIKKYFNENIIKKFIKEKCYMSI